jgi:hypothetical protein
MAQVRKPPVPQAGSSTLSSSLGIDPVDDEAGDGAGGVELARVAGALQVFQDLLVDAAEGVAVAVLLKSISQILLMTCRIRVPDFM